MVTNSNRSDWDREVGGSNPLAPTSIVKKKATRVEWLSCLWQRLRQTNKLKGLLRLRHPLWSEGELAHTTGGPP